MLSMMQGDAYDIRLTLVREDDDSPITDTDVAKVNITFGGTTKSFPNGSVDYDNGEWIYPVTQGQTIGMANVSELSVRVKFNSGDVEGAIIGNVYIVPSADKEEM